MIPLFYRYAQEFGPGEIEIYGGGGHKTPDGKDGVGTFGAFVQYLGARPNLAEARPKYCLWQCESPRKSEGISCCQDGRKDLSHFIKISDTRHDRHSRLAGGAEDITLLCQGTVSRIAAFERTVQIWPGPKVVLFAVYNVTVANQATAFTELAMILVASQTWNNTLVHALVINERPPSAGEKQGGDIWADFFRFQLNKMSQIPIQKWGPELRQAETVFRDGFRLGFYPINAMRNFVMDRAETNWVFPLDMDFIPNPQLYWQLRLMLVPRATAVDKVALVVPHFSMKTHGELPQSTLAMRQQIITGNVYPFMAPRTLLGHEFDRFEAEEACSRYQKLTCGPKGVNRTGYAAWWNATRRNLTGFLYQGSADDYYTRGTEQEQKKTKQHSYEPFVVIQRQSKNGLRLPRYPEEYVGRYRNKVAWIDTLMAQHYHFFVTFPGFLIHRDHKIASLVPHLHSQMHAFHGNARPSYIARYHMEPPVPPLAAGAIAGSNTGLGWKTKRGIEEVMHDGERNAAVGGSKNAAGATYDARSAVSQVATACFAEGLNGDAGPGWVAYFMIGAISGAICLFSAQCFSRQRGLQSSKVKTPRGDQNGDRSVFIQPARGRMF